MKITDKRGIEWELFMDTSYFELYCVKPVDNDVFQDISTFHFMRYEDAERFIKLIGESR